MKIYVVSADKTGAPISAHKSEKSALDAREDFEDAQDTHGRSETATVYLVELSE